MTSDAGRIELRYHGQTLRLLGVEPRWSAAAVGLIEACEGETGRRLPAAVREWYSLEGAETLLTGEYGGLLPLAEVLAGFARAGGRVPDLPVYRWRGPFDVSVRLDGSDDPPARGRRGTDRAEKLEPFYSRFVLNEAWGKMTGGRHWFRIYVGGGIVAESKTRAAPPHVDFLLEHFELLPRRTDSRPTSLRTMRFFGPAGRVELTADGDPTTGERPANWTLTADTDAAAVELYAMLWPCHGSSVSLLAFRDEKVRRRVRDRIRRRVPGTRFS